MRADPGGELDGIELGQGIGEQDEDEAEFAGVARKPLEAAFRIAAREDAELDVIDAERGGRAHGGANAVTFEREIADGGADRRAARDMPDASGDGVGGKRAERSLAGIFQVDDVGAGAKRQFGFLGVAHAGEEQGHRNSQLNMPPPPPPPAASTARRRHGGRRGGLRAEYRRRSKPQKSSRAAGALCRTLRS